MAEFDPRHIFDVLDRHGVRYVLIGGLARSCTARTLPMSTSCLEARDNLDRLSRA
jgi:hypothetical protein